MSYKDAKTKNEKRKPLKSCMISDLSYIDYIIANNTIKAIYLDFSMFHKKNTNTLQEAVIKAHSSIGSGRCIAACLKRSGRKKDEGTD